MSYRIYPVIPTAPVCNDYTVKVRKVVYFYL